MRSSKSEAASLLAEAGPSTSGQVVEEEEEYEEPTATRAVALTREIEKFLVEGMQYLLYGTMKESVLTHADAVRYKPVALLYDDDGSTTPNQVLEQPGGDDYVLLTVPEVRIFAFGIS